MNIKKRIPKFISLLLSFTIAFGNVIPAYAMENTNSDSATVIDGEDIRVDERNLEDITVTYKQASSFFVTIPKTIVLDGWKQSTYAVKVSGDIDAEQCVYVAPIDGIAETDNIDFYMKDQASKNAKDDVVASVTHNKFYWNSTEVAEGHKQNDNLVSAPDLTAGAWRGIFQTEIKLETHVTHKHNYVAAITKEPTCTEAGEKTYTCICGDSYTEEIPAKGHHFEKGECTDCGEKEADPYGIAPATAYSNWNYTLDDTNNIITLNYYIGSETDVIVYANYVVNDKQYKTQLVDIPGRNSSSTAYMFNAVDLNYCNSNCRNIESIKFSKNIDTSNLTDMRWMFQYCFALKELDISGFDTSNVTKMSGMFNSCYELTSLDLSNWNTSNVTLMDYMFSCCYKLENLDLSSFDTSNVTNMNNMFQYYGKALESISLDISSFDTHNVTNMQYMFYYASALSTIYVADDKWSVEKAQSSSITPFNITRNGTYEMFNNCGISTVTYK